MAKRPRYSDYHDRYANYRFELTDDGILFMQCHTNVGSLAWDWRAHDGRSDAFSDIAGDREIKVLIHTGTGENYIANWGRLNNGEVMDKPENLLMPSSRGLVKLDEKAWYATLLYLLYSMILVSYALNMFKQNRIPDSGAAFFDVVAEPAP